MSRSRTDSQAALATANDRLNLLLEQREAAMEGCGLAPHPRQIEDARSAVNDARWRVLFTAYTHATATTGEAMVAELRASLPDASDDEILSVLGTGNEFAEAVLTVRRTESAVANDVRETVH